MKVDWRIRVDGTGWTLRWMAAASLVVLCTVEWALAGEALAGEAFPGFRECCGEESAGSGCRLTEGIDAASNAWKTVWGTHESSPFRLENGKGMVNGGISIVSRPDWTIKREGLVYILYEVDPGNMEPTGFTYVTEEDEMLDLCGETLWIGLLGEDGEIVRKNRLGSGLLDISGIQTDADCGDHVTAHDARGRIRSIPLEYPRPWPPLVQKGNAWECHIERLERATARIGEDWPFNASRIAAWGESSSKERFQEKEQQQAVDILRLKPMTQACRSCLEGEPDRARTLAWEAFEGEKKLAHNEYWGGATTTSERERFMYPYMRNWLEGGDHPDGWMLVCNARGEFNGESFTATNGVALVGLEGWNKRFAEGEGVDRWGLLRLAPEQVRQEDGKTFVGFELIMPQFLDSAWKAGHGTFVEEGGTLHLQNLAIRLAFPWLRGMPEVDVEE